ncbi:MAG: hypothetical protein IPK72_05725 [Candidatus Eisenbacteria bacterium]|nr:hypothetical protein [Candidatus Eisenbacteria bacterium]
MSRFVVRRVARSSALLGYLTLALSALGTPVSSRAAEERAVERAEKPAVERFDPSGSALFPADLDPAGIATVEQLTLTRETARFTFVQGTLQFTRESSGRRWFAIFNGTGTAEVLPPIAIEQDQLERGIGAPKLERGFTSAALFLGDDPEGALWRGLTLTAGAADRKAQAQLEEFRSFLRDSETKEWHPALLQTTLNPERRGAFFIQLDAPKELPLFFSIEPEAFEPIMLSRAVTRGVLTSRERETLSRYAFPTAYENGRLTSDANLPAVAADDYRIETRIDDALEVRASCEVTVTARAGSWTWFPLELGEGLEVDSLRWEDGTPGTAVKLRDSERVWIARHGGLSAGAPERLRVVYHGDLLEHSGDLIHRPAFAAWYPEPSGWSRARFDLLFTHPKGSRLVATGTRLESHEVGRMRQARWRSEAPVPLAGFEIGYYDTVLVRDPRIPEVTVHWTPSSTAGAEEEILGAGMQVGASMERQVAADVANSLALFTSYWGAPSARSIGVAQAPRAIGLAYAGMIALDPWTFAANDRYRTNELFRAHEAAHQWWGVDVMPKSDHDRWLSEGFAEYASLRYVLDGLEDQETFLRSLRDWRKELLGLRRYIAGDGQPPAPIWLGYRTEGLRTAGDAEQILYRKGAWVLHMLQSMFLDLRGMNEEPFQQLLRTFHQEHAGGSASTADFERSCTAAFGAPLDWFFDQWVYGTDLPSYQVAHRTSRNADGTWTMRVRVRQSGVRPEFRAYPLLKVVLPENRYMRLRAHITGAEVEFDLPAIEMEPKGLVFGDLESILGEVKEVDW